MKVRDLLGAIRSNMVFEVEYRSENSKVCIGSSNGYELGKIFGDREVDDWFPLPQGGICINMTPEEEEEDDDIL